MTKLALSALAAAFAGSVMLASAAIAVPATTGASSFHKSSDASVTQVKMMKKKKKMKKGSGM